MADDIYIARRPLSCYRCGNTIQAGEAMTYIQFRAGGAWVSCCLKCAKKGDEKNVLATSA